MPEKISASIIIITKNQRELLKQSLPILLNQDFKENYEIIVVDSGSTDGAVQYVESLPISLIKINPRKFNYAKAFNTGAKTARGEFLVRLSGDCIPTNKDLLRELLEPFNDSGVGGTYGKYIITSKKGYGYPVYWPKERFPNDKQKIHIKPYFLMGILESFGSKQLLFSLAGGCCAIRKSFWEKRPFNENLTVAEDGEYAWLLHLAGYDIVYTPKAQVIHEHKIIEGQKSKTFSKWVVIYYWEFLKYWLLRMIFVDRYKFLRFSHK